MPVSDLAAVIDAAGSENSSGSKGNVFSMKPIVQVGTMFLLAPEQ